MAFNNPEYAFHEMKVLIGGQNIKILSFKPKGLNASTEYLHANNDQPIAIQVAENSPEFSMEMLRSQFQAMIAVVGGVEQIVYNPFDAVVVFQPKNKSLPLLTKTVKHIVIDNADEGMAQGDKYEKISLSGKFLQIIES